MRKVNKVNSLGYRKITESQISVLYYIWAKCDLTSYCSLVDSGTCYAQENYLTDAINLYADGFWEIDDNNAANYRLSKQGRDLVMKLGM